MVQTAVPVAGAPPEEALKQMPESARRLHGKWASLVWGLGDPATDADYVVITK